MSPAARYQQCVQNIQKHAQYFCRALQNSDPDPKNMPGIVEQVELEITRYRLRIYTLTVILIVLGFLFIKVKHLPEPRARTNSMRAAKTQYVPRYTLPANEQWVISYEQAARNFPTIEGPKTLSDKWLKLVAYHLIIGQQASIHERYGKALSHLEQASAAFPELQGLHEQLGSIYLSLGQWDSALEHLEAAMSEEESFATIINLGVVLTEVGEFERAEKKLITALEMEPDNPSCHKNMARLYQKMKQPGKAISYFERYLALAPTDLHIIETYANYLAKTGRIKRAREFLKNQTMQFSENALPLAFLLAKIEAQLTNTSQAVAELHKMMQYLSPNLLLTRMNQSEFDLIRDQEEFQALVQELEMSMVTLRGEW